MFGRVVASISKNWGRESANSTSSGSYTQAGTNNGKIATQKDNLSAETVTYQYDSLNRLLSATSSQSWSETYGFDGFGNLLSKTGTGGAPTLSQAVAAANNQIVGQSYDNNGNQTSGPVGGISYVYDAENRIASVNGAAVQYAYDSGNKRIWKSVLTAGNLAQEVYFYGLDGQKIGTYTFTLSMINNVAVMADGNNTTLATFFGGKRIGILDRLSTAKYNPNGQVQSFYPYGEDCGTVQPNDSLKFATYTRDSASGLDYADQRYYDSNWGRFVSPDPYVPSGGPGDPGSWNAYSYTRGDPVNRLDRSGLFDTEAEEGDCNPLEDPNCLPPLPPAPLPPGLPAPRQPDKGGPRVCSKGNELDSRGHCVPIGLTEAVGLLKDKKCAGAVGAGSSADALNTLANAVPTLSNLGELQASQTTDANGNSVITVTFGTLGESNTGIFGMFQSITLNNYGTYWTGPQYAQVMVNGQQTTTNLLEDQASLDGVSSLSVLQYQELTILHELKHLFSSAPDTTPAQHKAFDLNILQNCLGLTVN